MLIGEKLMLLALDRSGKVHSSCHGILDYGLAASFLMELHGQKALKDTAQGLKVMDVTPEHHLCRDLMQCMKKGTPRKTPYWLFTWGDISLRNTVLENLVQQDIIEISQRTLYSLLTFSRYRWKNTKPWLMAHEEIRDVLRGDVKEREAQALFCLVTATHLLQHIVPTTAQERGYRMYRDILSRNPFWQEIVGYLKQKEVAWQTIVPN